MIELGYKYEKRVHKMMQDFSLSTQKPLQLQD
jgi:hypothetical protein